MYVWSWYFSVEEISWRWGDALREPTKTKAMT